jgi:hypothetical protein
MTTSWEARIGLKKNIPGPMATGNAANDVAGFAERAIPATSRGREMTAPTTLSAMHIISQLNAGG